MRGIAVVSAGLPSWSRALPVLRGEAPLLTEPLKLEPHAGLPATERRRIGQTVKVALACASQLFEGSGISPTEAQTVFTSSGADGLNCHQLCEALAQPDPQVSPTRFTNSVHNAPAGYWGIATGATTPSVSLCAFDGSFVAGLIEAATIVVVDDLAVALVAYDAPYPEPLAGKRPIAEPFGVGLLLVPEHDPDSIAHLVFDAPRTGLAATPMTDPALECLRLGVPAARALPLLAALATRTPAASTPVCIAANDGAALCVTVGP